MKKIINLKNKRFKSIIYASTLSILSTFQVFSSDDIIELKVVNSKAKITNTDFVRQVVEKHASIKAKRDELEEKYIDLEQLTREPGLEYLATAVIKDLKSEFVKLSSNNFIKENINVPSKEVKKIKEFYKKCLSRNNEEKLNILSPTRHAHWPGSKERKDKISELQNDDIYVQHRLTNSSNLQRMETQQKDMESFLKDFPAKTAPLKNQVNENKINRLEDQVADQNQTINELKGQLTARDKKNDNQEKEINELKGHIADQNQKIDELIYFLMQTNNVNGNVDFICPITHELYQDPIITRCGHTFEHLPLISWLSQNPTCPSCRKDVNEDDLSPNISLRNVIQKLGNKPKKQMNNFNLIEIKEEKKDAQEE